MTELAKFDPWLTTDDVAAIVIREHLIPVEGADGVLFPATFAAAEDKKAFPGGYNIDPPEGPSNVCLVDSVGSQANRIEPMFAEPAYSRLVPQVTIKAAEHTLNLLDAGHRAGDALVRCTSLKKGLQDAFKAVLLGDAAPLARIAPTSIVFGVWDSRDTQAKLPRLISSTVRAFDVKVLRRSAQFNPAIEYINNGLIDDTTDKAVKDEYAKRGFIHVPASGSPGGVIATGGVRRDATFSLAALRLLAAGTDPESTIALRRYILGLSLVALTANAATYLRQGCNLVPNIDKPRESVLVRSGGTREPFELSHADALRFAEAAADAFGVTEAMEVDFDKELARQDIAGEGDVRATRKRAKKADTTAASA